MSLTGQDPSKVHREGGSHSSRILLNTTHFVVQFLGRPYPTADKGCRTLTWMAEGGDFD
jgi:hypothetical protein